MQAEILKWAELITKLLPEWNHSRAGVDAEKKEFLNSVREMVVVEQNAGEKIQKFQQLISEKVPDSHIRIVNRNQSESQKELISNSNLAFQAKKLKQACFFSVNPDKQDWIIATEMINGHSFGLVAIPSFSGVVDDKKRSKFVNFLLNEKNSKKWSAIVFDLRDNTGGDSTVVKEIAERLSGQSVQYADKTEIISYADKEIPKKYQDILSQKEHTVDMPDFVVQSTVSDKFSGPIYVLQNHLNASATEGAIYMLSQLPNCTTIGVPTKGAFQGGATVVLPLNKNYDLIIGTEYRERFCQNGVDKGKPILEKKGMIPDIYSTNAYFSALKMVAQQHDEKLKNNTQLIQKFKNGMSYE